MTTNSTHCQQLEQEEQQERQQQQQQHQQQQQQQQQHQYPLFALSTYNVRTRRYKEQGIAFKALKRKPLFCLDWISYSPRGPGLIDFQGL